MKIKIWIDITDPKYALFFSSLINYLDDIAEFIITIREGDSSGVGEYCEVEQILKVKNINFEKLGNYGGSSKIDKYRARLKREGLLLDFIKDKNIKIFISGASVEGVNVAFGLGIKIISFCDTPMTFSKSELGGGLCDYKAKNLSIVSKLMLPFSDIIFAPFVLPKSLFNAFGLDIVHYDFLDPVLYMEKRKNVIGLKTTLGLRQSTKLILAREEEYKAHYIKYRSMLIYEAIRALNEEFDDVKVIVVPRYGINEELKKLKKLKNVMVLDQIFDANALYAETDLLLGGGGTMNLEAAYFGTEVISLRSIWLMHDQYLYENKLMHHANTTSEVLNLVRQILSADKAKKPNSELIFNNFDKKSFTKNIEKMKDLIKHLAQT